MLVEALGRPFAGVLGVVRPVRLLAAMALVVHRLVALDVDEFGDQGGLDGRGRAVDMSLELPAESRDDAPDDGLVL